MTVATKMLTIGSMIISIIAVIFLVVTTTTPGYFTTDGTNYPASINVGPFRTCMPSITYTSRGVIIGGQTCNWDTTCSGDSSNCHKDRSMKAFLIISIITGAIGVVFTSLSLFIPKLNFFRLISCIITTFASLCAIIPLGLIAELNKYPFKPSYGFGLEITSIILFVISAILSVISWIIARKETQPQQHAYPLQQQQPYTQQQPYLQQPYSQPQQPYAQAYTQQTYSPPQQQAYSPPQQQAYPQQQQGYVQQL